MYSWRSQFVVGLTLLAGLWTDAAAQMQRAEQSGAGSARRAAVLLAPSQRAARLIQQSQRAAAARPAPRSGAQAPERKAVARVGLLGPQQPAGQAGGAGQQTQQPAPGPRPGATLQGRTQAEAPSFGSGVEVEAIDEAGVIILRGSPEEIENLVELIQRIEEVTATVEPFVRVFQLHRASATQVRDIIQQLYGQQAQAAPGQTGQAGAGPQRLTVTADERSNKLIVQASPYLMEEIADLIKRLDVDRAPVVNEVRVFQLRNASAQEVADILNSALQAAAAPAAPAAPAVPGAQPVTTAGGEVQIARRFAVLRFVQTDGKEQVIDSGILDEIRITPQVRTNSVLVSAPSSSMELLAAIIRELDRPPTIEAVTKVFFLQNSDATNLRQTLAELFDIEVAASAGALGGAAALQAQAGQLQRPIAVAPGENPPVAVRVAVDARTNALLVSGPQSAVDVIEAVIRRLDTVDMRARINRVVRLKNVRATDVATALNNFYNLKRQIEFQQAQLVGQQQLIGPYQRLEQEVVAVPLQDATTGLPVNNMLLISASPRYIDEVMEMIQKMDALQPQVMIQVMIAQLDVTDAFEFGIEWGLQDTRLFQRSEIENGVFVDGQGFLFNSGPGGQVGSLGNSASASAVANSADVAGQALANFVVGRVSSLSELGGASGLLLTASSRSVAALLRALEGQGRLEVISRPQIMTLDGTGARILVGEQFPFVSEVTGTQTTTTASVQFQDIGVFLEVTPIINPDGRIVMRVVPTVSELRELVTVQTVVTPTGTIPQQAPRIDTTTAESVVSVMDGQTIVIGGLIQKRDQETVRKIPWLGDLPYLGKLFRFTQHQQRKRELLIILTPHIVRGVEEAEQLKMIEAQRTQWVLEHISELQETGVVPLPMEEPAEGPVSIGAPEQPDPMPELPQTQPPAPQPQP